MSVSTHSVSVHVCIVHDDRCQHILEALHSSSSSSSSLRAKNHQMHAVSCCLMLQSSMCSLSANESYNIN